MHPVLYMGKESLMDEPLGRNSYVLLKDRRTARKVKNNLWIIYAEEEQTFMGAAVTDPGYVTIWPSLEPLVAEVLWQSETDELVDAGLTDGVPSE